MWASTHLNGLYCRELAACVAPSVTIKQLDMEKENEAEGHQGVRNTRANNSSVLQSYISQHEHTIIYLYVVLLFNALFYVSAFSQQKYTC